jgi:hypothetical protein
MYMLGLPLAQQSGGKMTTCRVKTSGQYARLFSFFSYTHREREREHRVTIKNFLPSLYPFFLFPYGHGNGGGKNRTGAKEKGEKDERPNQTMYRLITLNMEHETLCQIGRLPRLFSLWQFF